MTETSAASSSKPIPPFWQCIPRFLVLPFRPAPLVITAGLAAATVLTVMTGGYLRGLIAIVFLRYAYAVMEHASQGNFLPGWDDITLFGNKDKRPYKQNLVFVLYFFALLAISGFAVKPDRAKLDQAVTSAVTTKAPAKPAAVKSAESGPQASLSSSDEEASNDDDDDNASEPVGTVSADSSPRSDAAPVATDRPVMRATSRFEYFADPTVHFAPWFYLVAFLLSLPLPAAVMVMALEDSVLRALNPATTMYFIRAMKGSYFLVWLSFALGLFACQGAFHLLPESVNVFVRLPVQTFLSFYCMLVLYSLMGYALYQFHDELGLAVRTQSEQSESTSSVSSGSKERPKSNDPLIQKLDEIELSGNLDAAIRYAADELRYDKMHVALNERLYKLYLVKNDLASAKMQGQRTVMALLQAKRIDPAFRLLAELKASHENFQMSADLVLPCAVAHFARSEFKEALQLIKGFDKLYPGHADIPGVYLLGARISNDCMHKPAHAIQILKTLLNRYPQADCAIEAHAMLDRLQALETN